MPDRNPTVHFKKDAIISNRNMENDSKCHDCCVGVSIGHGFRKMRFKDRIVSKMGPPSSKHVEGLYYIP